MLRKSTPPRRSPSHPANPEIVDPRWLLKAGIAAFAFALLCALALFWTTFYYTQWQYVLTPSHAVAATPNTVGLSFTEVHFGVDPTGQPQLSGWWIPSDLSNARTVLVLGSGNGNMADSLATAQTLHSLHLQVLLFDYRGFGLSNGQHPTEALMQEDAQHALDYLRHTRGIHAIELVIYGRGVGAAIALHLCSTAGIECPAMILDSPDGDLRDRVAHDPRTKVIPVSWLFHQDFPLAAPLQQEPSPKLLITYGSEAPAMLHNARDPKMLLELPAPNDPMLAPSIQRFLTDHNPQD